MDFNNVQKPSIVLPLLHKKLLRNKYMLFEILWWEILRRLYELENILTFLTPEFKALTTLNDRISIVLH